ncbi:MAG: hypothetical protein LBF59_05555 [Prevotellaceae bacterium]|jgi:hypothetical protein|nr:hypothetical protein [Prevotellaceae bacterium]
MEERDLIKFVSDRTITNYWKNGRAGKFVDINNNCQYRFLETTTDCARWLVSPYNYPAIQELPIMACGFVAWLIKHWGEDTTKIYSEYLQVKLNQYQAAHRNDADVFKRDLEREFYDQYRANEEQWIKQSESIFEFISEREINQIKQYVQHYFEYVSTFGTKYNQTPLYRMPAAFMFLCQLRQEWKKLMLRCTRTSTLTTCG